MRAGTETSTFEMDDWNRTRSSTEIHCPQCREKRQRELDAEYASERRRDELLERAAATRNRTLPCKMAGALRRHDEESGLGTVYGWFRVSGAGHVLSARETLRQPQQIYGVVPDE
jgi:hypothetical protein